MEEQQEAQRENNDQQQDRPRHLWHQDGVFGDHGQHLRQIWADHQYRRHLVQQVRAWQEHREDDYEIGPEHLEQPQEEEGLPAVRSRTNRISSFIRFINKSNTRISVFWIDYQGSKVFYKLLNVGDYLDINTFVTHPWIFIDARTGMRYPANGQYVHFPDPWYAQYEGDVENRSDVPIRFERKNVYIKTPLKSLRELCLWSIALRLSTDEDAYKLELPKSLQRDLLAICALKADIRDQD